MDLISQLDCIYTEREKTGEKNGERERFSHVRGGLPSDGGPKVLPSRGKKQKGRRFVLSPGGWLNPVMGEFLADVLQILVSRLFIPLLVRGGLDGAVCPIFGLG